MQLSDILSRGICLLSLFIIGHAVAAEEMSTNTPAESAVALLLEQAHSHLSQGEAREALDYFNAALARNPTDYLTLFKRATALLSLGRTSLATDDFGKALELEPNFEGAHMQLANIRTRIGDWELARKHYIQAHRTPDSVELRQIDEAQGAANLAHLAESAFDWEECTQQANAAISVANRASALRQTRARCHLQLGNIDAALADLQYIARMQSGDPTIHVNISAITMYNLGDTRAAMMQARRCLQLDPDSKPCRKLLANGKRIVQKLESIIKLLPTAPMTATGLLVGTLDEPGLISQIKIDREALARDGILPLSSPNELLSMLLGLACQGCYVVSFLCLVFISQMLLKPVLNWLYKMLY